MMNLKCQCCGFEQSFKDGEEAFDAGWDAPPHFTTHVCCLLCPAVCVVMGAGHAKAHALWAKEGRPKDFALSTCATDETFGDPAKLAQAARGIEEMTKAVADLEGIFKRWPSWPKDKS